MKPYWEHNNVKLYCGDCLEVMQQIKRPVQLTITSPPYNCHKDYGQCRDDLEVENYLDWIDSIALNLFMKTEFTGRVCWNVGMSYLSDPEDDLYNWLETMRIFRENGWKQYTTLIWAKGKDNVDVEKLHLSTTAGCAWGSWCSASAPAFRGCHEYIMVFYRDSRKRNRSGISDITKDEFIENTLTVWPMVPKSDKVHPAVFPIALPYRLIRTFSYVDDTIFDPFCGSGTTMIAALMTGRPFIGIEINEEYCELAVKKAKTMLSQQTMDL